MSRPYLCNRVGEACLRHIYFIMHKLPFAHTAYALLCLSIAMLLSQVVLGRKSCSTMQGARCQASPVPEAHASLAAPLCQVGASLNRTCCISQHRVSMHRKLQLKLPKARELYLQFSLNMNI